jgi:GMP synthase (glutamine-hydrolysing)
MNLSTVDTIVVLDFGGQYAHLIANRIRRLGVYSEIVQPDVDPVMLKRFKGIILSGSPHSILNENSPRFESGLLSLKIPVLGLCYGHQHMCKTLGGAVSRGGTTREYGIAQFNLKTKADIFTGLNIQEQVWMSHGDTVSAIPEGFEILGSTDDCVYAAVGDPKRHFYGLQFHPEVTDTPCGMKILSNFIEICNCKRQWNSDTFLESIAEDIRQKAGKRNVFLLVSGGVDSTVAFSLLNNVLGKERVLGVHIDNGLMRLDESEAVLQYMNEHGYDNLEIIDASDDFLSALDGVTEPEKKRKIIGDMFLTVKEKAYEKFGLNADEWLLAQGTIYPDTIESAGTKHADRIKTHHNRVDLILELIEKGLVIEPLAHLYKDEVREIGEKLGIPHSLVWRHPFPGPGLGVRVLCSDGTTIPVKKEESDAVDSIIASNGYTSSILPVKSVGVQGDERSYAHPVLICGKCDWELLEKLSTKITNSVRSVNRVVFGIKTGKSIDYTLIKAGINRSRLDKLRKVDHIVTEALRSSGEYNTIWQLPVVLLPLLNSEGNECVVIRPIVSQEAMTARFAPLAQNTIDTIIKQVAMVEGIGDLFFDITHKPPATIEWE